MYLYLLIGRCVLSDIVKVKSISITYLRPKTFRILVCQCTARPWSMCFLLQCNFRDSVGFFAGNSVVLDKTLIIAVFNLSCYVNHDCAIFKYFLPIIIHTNQGLFVVCTCFGKYIVFCWVKSIFLWQWIQKIQVWSLEDKMP